MFILGHRDIQANCSRPEGLDTALKVALSVVLAVDIELSYEAVILGKDDNDRDFEEPVSHHDLMPLVDLGAREPA